MGAANEEYMRCGTCHPTCVPKTPAGQRAVQRYDWCPKCQCGRAYFPAAFLTTKSAKDDGKRPCRWTGCPKRVEPKLWACKPHWYALPAALRNEILAAYQPGQEDDLTMVSKDWVTADRRARDWIEAQAKG